jgi:phosphatidylserine/phosphatidylglycerophosphate/cardiolipin synthase-like enzyme
VKNLHVNDPESRLIKQIETAQHSFYGSFYEISAQPVINALIKAKTRGLDVKLVVNDHIFSSDKSSKKFTAFKGLITAGIPVITDDRPQLMHNKFAVIDNRFLWTGSYNLTYNCARRNNNNAVLIDSSELSSIYLEEFFEMFDNRVFGNKTDDLPFSGVLNLTGREKYYVKVGGADVNAYFAPENNVEKIIIRHLNKAEKSIRFMAFSFTSNKIAETMAAASKRGVNVSGIFEKKGSDGRYSKYRMLKSEGIKVKTDKNKHLLHHKVIIIDDKTVITGSYNFSKNANKNNDENIVIIHDSTIAELYINEFNRLR